MLEDDDGEPLRITIIQEDSLLSSLLRDRLAQEPGLQVLSCVPDPAAMAQALDEDKPHVVMIDLHWAGAPSPTVVERATRMADGPAVLVLSGDDSEELQLSAVRSGARGFVSKAQGMDKLVDAIQAVGRGEVWFTRRLSERVFADYCRLLRQTESRNRPIDALSVREKEVLNLVAQGLTNKQIAETLFMSVHTAKLHVQRILQKLNLPNRTEAAVLAVSEGLVPPATSSRLVE